MNNPVIDLEVERARIEELRHPKPEPVEDGEPTLDWEEEIIAHYENRRASK